MTAHRNCLFVLLALAASPLFAQSPRIETDPNLPNGRVNVPYLQVLSARGGTIPYRWELLDGTLPPGIEFLSQLATLAGLSPSAAGDYAFRIRVTDSDNKSDTQTFHLTVTGPQSGPSIQTTSLPAGTLGAAYSANITATGGNTPYTWAVSAGTLPGGLALDGATGAIAGTPTAAGNFDFTARVTDANNLSSNQQLRITINPAAPPPLTVTTTALSNGTVGQAYSGTIAASGGTPPYSWSISAGALPTGLTLASTGAISGTPTAAGAFDFTARVADSATQSATKQLRITVSPAAPPPLSITTTTLTAGTVGQAYSGSLASTGGTPPIVWTVSAGALPAGLSLSSAGGISGTPTTAGDFDFTARAADSASQSATQQLRITVNPAAPAALNITTTTLGGGTVGQAYSGSLTSTGGTPPVVWTVSAGALPAGVSLSSAGGISGTPTTAGDFDFTVRAADSANQSATKQLRISVAPAPPAPLNITTTTLGAGTVGQAYSGNLSATGGTPPLTWTAPAGTFPPGLSLSTSGAISGTPTAAGDFDFTARVADSANQSATKQLRITVKPAPAAPLNITTTALGAGTVGQSYSGNLSATGGTPPLSWSAPTGTFPPGLGLSASGAISGTPTAAGAFDFTVRVADSANQTASKALRITINAAGAPPSITTATLPNATTGVDYSQTIAATGGKAPLTWSVSAGALPAGLRLDASTGRITGAPSSVGSFSFTVRATDADSRTGERPLAITVVAALVISGCPVPSGTAGVNYSSSVSAAGGTPPYTWSVSAGQVPPGITLAAATGLFSGTPTATGAFNFTLSAGDSAGRQATRACSIVVSLNLQIINDSLPDATTRAIYSQTLRATGGATPYRWTAIAGSLPPGLTLDENTGLIAGQPTQPGRFSFTVQLTDAAGGQIQRAYTISVGTGLTIPSCPTPVGSVNESYTSTLAAVGGQAPYAWAIDSGTLPQGLRLAADTGVISGTPAAPGASNFSLRASDAGGNTASRACSIQIAPELTITTTSLPQAEAGGAYAAAIVAVGGTPPYVWSISTGSLAPGLTLNAASGQISGTSTAAGAFRFTARVTDAAGIQSDKQFDLTVGSGFVIAACPTPTATLGDPYSSSLSTAGGEAPIAWSISSGSLPTGIALDPQAGTVTGTATAIASSDFVVSATDSKSKATTRACSIAVTAPALSISQPAALADALLGTPYEQTLQASGGRAPYAWSVLSGSLPPGLTLAPGGVISGSASTVGTYSITIRAGDADQRAATRAFDIRVLPAKAPGITFMDLPDIVPPAQQPVVRLKLDSVYPTALRGKLSLRFTPDPGLNVDDPSVRFVTGDRTVDFDIPENSMEAVFPVPQLALQTGSVAGAIDLNVTLASGDLDVSPAPGPARTVRIDRTAPVITNVRLNNVPGGFEVLVTGFATTREVTSATFQFTPATGSRLEASQVTVQTEASAKQWFADTRSANFGSQFTFVQPFTLQNATLSEVTVTLTNAQGTSQPVRARF